MDIAGGVSLLNSDVSPYPPRYEVEEDAHVWNCAWRDDHVSKSVP